MRAARAILSLLFGAAMLPLAATPVQADVDVYITEGTHTVNGREWRTECEPYSATERCRTEIMATVVTEADGVFTQKTDWAFNNLTYKAAPRSLWKDNPLAASGLIGGYTSWVAEDGRQWRTECDTEATGRGACRSYLEASMIEATKDEGNTVYRWVTKELFNNIVRFTADQPPARLPVVTELPDPMDGWKWVARHDAAIQVPESWDYSSYSWMPWCLDDGPHIPDGPYVDSPVGAIPLIGCGPFQAEWVRMHVGWEEIHDGYPTPVLTELLVRQGDTSRVYVQLPKDPTAEQRELAELVIATAVQFEGDVTVP